MRRTISKRFKFLLIASVLAIALLLGTRAIVHRGPSAETIHSDAVQEVIEGATGLEAVEPSEELVAKHPFIYAGIHLDKIYELDPLWTSHKYADLRLLPLPSNDNLVGELGSLSGYQLQGASFTPFLRRSSNKLGTWYHPHFSQVPLELTFQSNLWPGIVNWIIPLMIINSIVLMAPSVEGTLSDVRLAIPSTALLTLIFLQQSYHASLPKLPYTTFLDDLFTTSYLIAMALFALFTWGYNAYIAAPDEQKASTMRRINQADMRFQYLSLCLLVLTAVISWGRR